jgi:hypothetical protein
LVQASFDRADDSAGRSAIESIDELEHDFMRQAIKLLDEDCAGALVTRARRARARASWPTASAFEVNAS